MNYNYIKTTLCENKEKPVLKCDGKCYLAKQLKKEVQNQEPQKPTFQLDKDIWTCSNVQISFPCLNTEKVLDVESIFFYTESISINHPISLIKPPADFIA